MAQLNGQVAVHGPDRAKALKILAKSIFKELRTQGYDSKSVVSLATELIALVTEDLAAESNQSSTEVEP